MTSQTEGKMKRREKLEKFMQAEKYLLNSTTNVERRIALLRVNINELVPRYRHIEDNNVPIVLVTTSTCSGNRRLMCIVQ